MKFAVTQNVHGLPVREELIVSEHESFGEAYEAMQESSQHFLSVRRVDEGGCISDATNSDRADYFGDL